MELYEAIRGRRSIRQFRGDAVPRGLIDKILQVAMWAPSGMNQQNWYFVVVRGERLQRLRQLCKKAFDRQIKGVISLVFHGNPTILEETEHFFATLGNAPVAISVYRTETPEGDLTDIQSVAAAIQNLLLAAYAEGLGACWMTGPLAVEEEINLLLGMQGKRLQALIPIGYPASSPPAPRRRGGKIKWLRKGE